MSYEEKEETDITRNNHSDSIVAIKTTHDDQEEKDETAYEAQSYSIEEDEEESDDDKDDRSNPTKTKTKTKSKNHIDISEAPSNEIEKERTPHIEATQRKSNTNCNSEFLGESGFANEQEKEDARLAFEMRENLKLEFQKQPLHCCPVKGYKTNLFQCVIVRNRNGNGLFCSSYSFFFQGEEKPLMVAQKQGGNRTSNYHFFDMGRGALNSKLSKKR